MSRSRRRGHALASLAAVLPLACAGGPRPHVLLILIDTLRKDHLHVYGHAAPLSPTMDALAENGVVFEGHVAHASQTVPSVLSLMLSRLPAEHGFSHRRPGQFAESRPRFPEEFLFLAEIFRDAGYATAGFVANPFLGPENGFDQGFESFFHEASDAMTLTSRAADWLEARGRQPKTPAFLYLHYMDVHQPYAPPPAYAERLAPSRGAKPLRGYGPAEDVDPRDLAHSRALYAAGVRYLDDQIALLLKTLERVGIREQTLIVLTSDHGEEFLEHGGLGHGTTVYGELVRVPLVMVYPRELEAGRRVRHLSRHLDLAPEILRLAGIEAPAELRGRSVFEPAERAFAENGPWRAVYAGGEKLVWNAKTRESRVFDADDEHDLRPRRDAAAVERLSAELDRYRALEERAVRPSAPADPWSHEELERLRDLGYAQ